MSLKASSWAWDQPVTGMHKLVLLAIADYAGRENNSAWPSLDTLAKRCGISRMTAVRAIRELEEKDLVKLERRANRTNVYHLPVGDSEGYQSDRGYQRVTTVVSESDCGSNTVIPEPVKNQSRTSNIPSNLVEAIYNAYPRKVARPAALAAIKKALRREQAKGANGLTADSIQTATSLWATACAQKMDADPDARKYIKHPATWFNQQCYLEDPAEWGIQPKRKTQLDRDTDALLESADKERERVAALIEKL